MYILIWSMKHDQYGCNIVTPHDCLENELSDKYNIAPLISTNCKVPDHSIVHLTFKVNALNNHIVGNEQRNEHIGNGQEGIVHGDIEGIHRRYRFESIPDLFITSDWLVYCMQRTAGRNCQFVYDIL